jgi:hypothetical protein
MEAVCSSKTLVPTCQTIVCHNPEGHGIDQHNLTTFWEKNQSSLITSECLQIQQVLQGATNYHYGFQHYGKRHDIVLSKV